LERAGATTKKLVPALRAVLQRLKSKLCLGERPFTRTVKAIDVPYCLKRVGS
jgi:hypothetical protein